MLTRKESLSIASLGGFLLFSKYLHSSIPFGVIHTYLQTGIGIGNM